MTPESWSAARPYVLVPLALGLMLLLLGRKTGWLGIAAAVGSLLFFRDPERSLSPDPGTIYAAADGVVTAVDEVEEPLLPGGRGVRVSTFLSLHNVHVNRSPVTGRVARIEKIGGGYAPALFRTSAENRRNRVKIEGAGGGAVVVQKAGAIARRISSWIGEGETVKAGQRIGIIHFGSRTDVILPARAADPLVAVGDRVRAGLTPLARYRREDGS